MNESECMETIVKFIQCNFLNPNTRRNGQKVQILELSAIQKSRMT